jgi:hypothetical protein
MRHQEWVDDAATQDDPGGDGSAEHQRRRQAVAAGTHPVRRSVIRIGLFAVRIAAGVPSYRNGSLRTVVSETLGRSLYAPTALELEKLTGIFSDEMETNRSRMHV